MDTNSHLSGICRLYVLRDRWCATINIHISFYEIWTGLSLFLKPSHTYIHTLRVSTWMLKGGVGVSCFWVHLMLSTISDFIRIWLARGEGIRVSKVVWVSLEILLLSEFHLSVTK